MTNRPVLISPSLLSADMARLGEEVRALEEGGADRLHFDVMDSHFVPQLSFGPDVLRALKSWTSLPIDAHLMVSQPHFLVERFLEVGAKSIILHLEIEEDLEKLLKKIKQGGCEVGLALNPETPVSAIEPFQDLLDWVLVMTVYPGLGGQPFLEGMETKIQALEGMKKKSSFKIQVDGGVSSENAGRLRRAGADVLVAGTAIFKSSSYEKAIEILRFS
ncbi:MAG: ribulose-phosphate 3-epimerase [Holosporales bacterium]